MDELIGNMIIDVKKEKNMVLTATEKNDFVEENNMTLMTRRFQMVLRRVRIFKIRTRSRKLQKTQIVNNNLVTSVGV